MREEDGRAGGEEEEEEEKWQRCWTLGEPVLPGKQSEAHLDEEEARAGAARLRPAPALLSRARSAERGQSKGEKKTAKPPQKTPKHARSERANGSRHKKAQAGKGSPAVPLP